MTSSDEPIVRKGSEAGARKARGAPRMFKGALALRSLRSEALAERGPALVPGGNKTEPLRGR
jgi:hypothetical protein